ncbi:MAG: zinc-dependent alcohol dehydrogenase family protein [Acidobacteriota bacterium]
MRAAILKKQKPIEENPLEIVEISEPVPENREIRVKISYCGICHTDLHIVKGDLPLKKIPVIPGHQIIGIVDKMGNGVKKFKEGDRVGIPWLNSTCGRCYYCKNGMENLCDGAKFTGYHVDGGYSEYTVVSEDFAYKVPEEFVDIKTAPLFCAGVIGFRALRLSNVREGSILGLFGFGASAHIVIQVAKYLNCRVFVFSRSEKHRKMAEKLGAEWTGTINDKPPDSIESGIIFAPAGDIVIEALKILKKGGTLALAGIYMSPIPGIEYKLIYNERSIKSVANSTRQDVIDFLEIARKVPVHPEVQVFPLEQANHALTLLKHGKINGAGVLQI